MIVRRALLLSGLVGLLGVAGLAGLPHLPSARADAPTPADLVRTLGGEDVTKRYDAYSRLIAKRPPEALPLLAKAVPGMPVAAQSLGFSVVQGYPQADVKAVFERWTTSDAPYLRAAAGAALLRQGEPKAVPGLVKTLVEPGLEPSTLAMMVGQLYGLREEKVLAAVRSLLRPEASPEVLAASLTLLQGVGDEGSVPPARALLAAPSLSVRTLGAAFLLAMGDESVTDDLATAVASGELVYADFMRVAALLTKAPRCPDKVLDAIVALAESEPTGYSLPLLANTLGHFGYPKAVPWLRKLLDHADAYVSKAAFEALSKIPGALTPEVTKGLLTAKDETRRVAAAEALRRADDLSGLSAVIDVLEHGTTARADAARALGAFRSRAAVAPLIAALLDADASVRAGAYNALVSCLGTLFPYRRVDLASTGYVTTAPPEARAAAVARLRAWWDAHKDGPW